MPTGRRKCKQCGINRQVKFFRSDRAVKCNKCLTQNRRQQVRHLRVATTYGMSKDDMQQLLDYQGGLCAICRGRRDVLDVDHDHAKERLFLEHLMEPARAARESVRGLLCARCNRQLLKWARNDPSLLRAAAEYLENPPWSVVKEEIGEAE